MIKDKFDTKDKMSLVLKGPDGKVKDRRLQGNVGIIEWLVYLWQKIRES